MNAKYVFGFIISVFAIMFGYVAAVSYHSGFTVLASFAAIFAVFVLLLAVDIFTGGGKVIRFL